ncbi:trichohyalin isoform X2 [Oncorhynchus mykiss]|uniref:Coiled-coil domain-containing protein n=1 Tax=Oncorhynchus mykiss TaxID=8022 RepID=A0A8C7PUF8_ONCMY|nr:trichohyalin isoform X2 [Oncorhynchus mykiss]XP_036802975.1 trichohyalin isoform X2 [Oncorhynchus mykiss]
MTELEIDQSHLPRVQEVCHVFAVLEDGALAHNLQEQEIEQYYTTNMQKNQLVQNDIRIAKRLQNEEEEQRAQHRALLSQASRQLQEEDSEYARMIQEEILRCADEEAQRREQEDEEMAKRIQEEEGLRVRQRSRQESLSDDSASVPASPCPHQPALSTSPIHGEELRHQPATSRWQCSISNTQPQSDSTAAPLSEPYRTAGQNNRTLSSRDRHMDPPRIIRNNLQCPPPDYLSDEGSEHTDTVFPEHLPPSRPCRQEKRLNTAPSGYRTPVHQPQERSSGSLSRHNRFREDHGRVWERGRGEREERGSLQDRDRIWDMNPRVARDGGYDRDPRSEDGRERHYRGRTSDPARGVQDRDRDEVRRSWTHRETSDKKQVRFQDDTSRRCHSYHGDSRRAGNVWELIAHDLRERGVALRQSFNGGSRSQRTRGKGRDSQVHDGGNTIACNNSQPQRAFQMAICNRPSYHGDVRERSASQRESLCHREGEREKIHENLTIEEASGTEVYDEHCRNDRLFSREGRSSGTEVYDEHCRNDGLFSREGRSSGTEVYDEHCRNDRLFSREGRSSGTEVYDEHCRNDGLFSREGRSSGTEVYDEHCRNDRLFSREREGRSSGDPRHKVSSGGDQAREEGRVDRHYHSERRVRSESEHQHEEDKQYHSEEERPPPSQKVSQRSQSFCSRGPSIRARSKHTHRAGAALQPEKGACLDLGELQQVLLDEELARRLQEEEKLLRRSLPARPSHYQRDSYPAGDFRVAQVAQDEEIARFMQKQEMKSKRRSRDLDGPGSQREPHDLADPYDRRTARDRRIQRERLGSEDLPSPTEDCSPDYQAPRPTTQSQQPIRIRNIAEELDPTFKASRQGKEGIRAGPTISGTSSCQSHPTPHSGLHDFMEEPTFIPPTKRQSAKSKEKKENCKQQ